MAKDKKKKKNDDDEQTLYKRMTWMPSKSLKHYQKTLKKSKWKNKVKNIINLVCATHELLWNWFNIFVYNIKMPKNQRPFTGTEIDVKLS